VAAIQVYVFHGAKRLASLISSGMFRYHAVERSQGRFVVSLVILHQTNRHQRTRSVAAARIFFDHLLQPHNGRIVIAYYEIGIWYFEGYVVSIIRIRELLNDGA